MKHLLHFLYTAVYAVGKGMANFRQSKIFGAYFLAIDWEVSLNFHGTCVSQQNSKNTKR